MMLYFSVLTSISAKGGVVPGHIRCIHVYKVNVNPEIDTKRNEIGDMWDTGEFESVCFCYHVAFIYHIMYSKRTGCCVCYLSGEMPRCLLSSPHSSLEYCLLWAPLILPMLQREQRAQGSPFPPNIIIWSGLICTAMYWYMQDRDTKCIIVVTA